MAKTKHPSKVKILIVDNHETSRNVIAIMLHKLGYPNVQEAGDANDADKIISTHTRKNDGMASLLGGSAPKFVCALDMVILDNDTPPNGGVMYLAQLRQKFKPADLPILFIAMRGKEESLEGAGALDANDTLVKPFNQAALKNKISPLLNSGKAPVIQSFDFASKPKALKPPEPVKALRSTAVNAVAPAAKQSKPASAKSKTVKNTPDPTNKKPVTGGVSFHRRTGGATYSTDGQPTATLVNGAIDGHYHEKVDVIGGGENCYWATGIDGEKVRLDYLNTKGKNTGIEAKIIPQEQFMYTFYFCDEGNCPILKRLSAQSR